MRAKYNCPVEIAMEVLGGRWKTRILWELFQKKCYFNELLKMIPDITKKMLIQCLRELEVSGLVKRNENPGKIIRVQYELTPYGKETIPLIEYMSEWGSNHRSSLDTNNETNFLKDNESI
ncbi:winged helix-turn-helix transcriptional regulator [Bacillus sp. CGMCC 1.16607]|uniref:winged helix-turn-helix transcriptional regulator n=1 Tax=Bacillus sp. CGMCC 1.16607 TaxID=3351842 RepID=UPI0036386B73